MSKLNILRVNQTFQVQLNIDETCRESERSLFYKGLCSCLFRII